jgi:DNA-binding PadR family transcriptional regulator
MTDESKIIAALSFAGKAMSGHQIRQVTGIWPLSVYQLLGRLEKQGVIETEWADESYRRRRLYRVAT